MKDDIIQEVWKAKDDIAARHGHDVRRLAEYLRNRERSCGHAVIDLHAQEMNRRTIGVTVRH